ncbi:LysR family transcriptional regulator [Paraburkholderia sp. Ac-20340]|uniref:LysR family transcriptional regulator n=1 Tax=Paraburkholderia sp. Ac-20340 TaxID=2703888 RepID=UPI00197E050C|nr:LysR substrate-binding domain-containing protein [Paraburkholderia sp. Ac-20340]MBN3854901.1 LysR family transcriptional regulator [Paraburkholderia sp. Ac-20340]
MKLNQLRALVSVAETGSILEASRKLHVTQSALSKTLKELETNVGATLFVRSSKGVQLTAYGQRLVAHARLIGENVRRARDDIEEMKGNVVSEISIGVTPVTALLRPLAEILSRFRKDFPRVRLRVQELRPNQLLEQVREGTIDFGITSQQMPPDGALDCTSALRMATLVAARKGHPLRAERSLQALHEADWLVLDPLSDPNTPFVQLFARHGIEQPSHVIECSSMSLALAMCSQLDTLILLSAESTSSRFMRDTMDFLELDESMPERVISLVTRDRHTLPESAARLYVSIVDALRDYDPLNLPALKP